MSTARDQILAFQKSLLFQRHAKLLGGLYEGKALDGFYYREGLSRECRDEAAIGELKRVLLWLHSEHSLIPARLEFEVEECPGAAYLVARGVLTQGRGG